MDDRPKGSMEALGALQVTNDMEGLDTQSKTLLQYAEVLAVILRDTVEEYKGYSWKEVAGFIETDSITKTMEVSPGRTNTKIRRDMEEYKQLVLFRSGISGQESTDFHRRYTDKPTYRCRTSEEVQAGLSA